MRYGITSKGARAATTIGSVLGFVIALAVAPALPSHSAVGQLPGYAAEHGFDPRTDVLRLLIFAVFPLIGGAAGMRFVVRRAPSKVSADRGAGPGERARVAAHPALLVPAAAAHAIGVWTFLLVPLTPGIDPIRLLILLLAVSFGLAAALGKGDPRRGAVFLAAGCPILPLALLGERSPALWLAAGVAGLLLPALARTAAAVFPRIVRPLRVIAVAFLLPGSVMAFLAAATLHAPPVADLFEDGHGLLPASEYLRGELPYRDIVPGHGLVSDGLLQVAQIRVFGDDYRGLRRGTKISGAFFWPAFYALGYAATGSATFGFGGMLFSFLFFPWYEFTRSMLCLWTLALAIYASRAKKAGAWLACGAVLPLNLCVAVEFGVYAAGGVAVALWVARGRRRVHLRRLALGAGLSGAAIALVFGALGILGAFARTTFLFVPSLLPAYALGFPAVALPGDPTDLGILVNRLPFLYGFVAASVLLLGALLPRAPAVGPRARGMLPVLAWIVFAMLSVLERHHVEYPFLAVPLGLLLLQRWFRGRRPWRRLRALSSGAALVLLGWHQRPVLLTAVMADAVVQARPRADTRPLGEPPRARGAVFRQADIWLIQATAEMMEKAGFRKNDTWLDFANTPGLYYLFDRDCPIRYYEVPFYESESAQREVIDAVARNPRVRAALMSSGYPPIDFLPMSARAPLVASFIRENFRPFYRAGGIEFWLRKGS